jgi:cytochrome c peroxidase
MHQKIQKAEDISRIPNDFSFLHGLRRRIPLSGQGPRSLVLHETKAYIGLYFSDAVDVVDLTQGAVVTTLPLEPKKPVTEIRRGQMLFNDGNLCFQKWQSCASCHPDGFMDALNWDLLNDGVGNHKNVKSLLLSHVTPPVMSSGIRPNAEDAVRAGMHHIQFLAIDQNDANALDAYLKSMTPIPSPYLVNGQLSASARRGARLFDSAGCARCHSGPYLTDMKSHAVGTGRGREADWKWDTPTLINVWKTAPYLHDGRAVTIQEVLTTENPHDHRGTTSTLTQQEINDLTEFVLSQ